MLAMIRPKARLIVLWHSGGFPPPLRGVLHEPRPRDVSRLDTEEDVERRQFPAAGRADRADGVDGVGRSRRQGFVEESLLADRAERDVRSVADPPPDLVHRPLAAPGVAAFPSELDL